MSTFLIIIAALAVYGLFAAIRRGSSADEVEMQRMTDMKMHSAEQAIDEAAENDPRAI